MYRYSTRQATSTQTNNIKKHPYRRQATYLRNVMYRHACHADPPPPPLPSCISHMQRNGKYIYNTIHIYTAYTLYIFFLSRAAALSVRWPAALLDTSYHSNKHISRGVREARRRGGETGGGERGSQMKPTGTCAERAPLGPAGDPAAFPALPPPREASLFGFRRASGTT